MPVKDMDSARKQAVIESFIEAYNNFDMDGMAALLHPHCRFKNVSAGEVNASAEGVDEFRALAERSAPMFSARRQTITRYEEDEDTIRVEIDYEGVLGLDLPAGPKAGELVRLQGRSVYKFREGMIFELTDYI